MSLPGTSRRCMRAAGAAVNYIARIAGITSIIRIKSFDSLDVMEKVMRHFYLRALIEERMGSQTDWNAVDSLMLKALASAEKVARYRHAQLSAVKIAGELKSGPADGATLDELLERIKHQLTKLGPILELEVAREPQG